MIYYGLEWKSLDTYFQMKELSVAPPTPQAHEIRLYAKDNGSGVSTLCVKNDAGNEICLPTSGTLITGVGVAGRVAFWDGVASLSSDADLTFSIDTLTATKVSIPTSAGIGTAPPSTGLHILGANDTELFRISATNQILSVKENTSQSACYFTLGTDNQTNAFLIVPETLVVSIDAANNSTDRSFRIFHNSAINTGTQLFEVKEDGKVYIGPGERTHTGSDGFLAIDQDTNGVIAEINAHHASGNASIFAHRSRGTHSSPSIVSDGDAILHILGKAYGNDYHDAARISFFVDGTPGSGDMPGRIVFYTTPDGSASLAEAARITSAGDLSLSKNIVLVATTSSAGIIKRSTSNVFHTFGTENTFLGENAGNLTLSGANFNTALGALSLQALTSGDSNTAVGRRALIAVTEGSDNIGIGVNAGAAITTGNRNIVIGPAALASRTTGDEAVAIGFEAANAATTASLLVAIGTQALALLTTGARNVAVGATALATITTGSECTAVGRAALNSTTGDANTAIGHNAGLNNTSGINNVFIGNSAGDTNTTGLSNTFIGRDSDASANNLSKAIALGYNTVVGASNSLVIGAVADEMKVGWGTTTPTVSQSGPGLHLKGGNVGIRLEASASGGWSYIEYYDDAGVGQFMMGYRDTNTSFQINADNTFAADPSFTVLSDGKVGLNYGTPTQVLDLNGNVRINNGGGATSLAAAPTRYLVVDSGGGTTPGLVLVGDRRWQLRVDGSEFVVFDDTANSGRWKWDTTGNYKPASDAAYDLGSAALRVKDGFFSGTLRFGTHSALGAETVTGYITMTDAGGTTRKMAVVS